jgi:lysophospholipase L1-like esterase
VLRPDPGAAPTAYCTDGPGALGCADGRPTWDRPPKKTVFAMVGDSITAGYGSTGVENDYPSQFRRLLDANLYDVYNEGVSARTMLKSGDHPYWNEPQYTETLEMRPDVIVLMLGTNDAKTFQWNRAEFLADYTVRFCGHY